MPKGRTVVRRRDAACDSIPDLGLHRSGVRQRDAAPIPVLMSECTVLVSALRQCCAKAQGCADALPGNAKGSNLCPTLSHLITIPIISHLFGKIKGFCKFFSEIGKWRAMGGDCQVLKQNLDNLDNLASLPVALQRAISRQFFLWDEREVLLWSHCTSFARSA